MKKQSDASSCSSSSSSTTLMSTEQRASRKGMSAAAVAAPNGTSSYAGGITLAVPTLRDRAPKTHYRVVVMGAAGVGKSCIISQFLYERFVNEYKATVEELHRGQYEIYGKELTLDILDTSGSFEFPAMQKLSISTGDAFVLVYSLDDESSFQEVKRLRELIIEQKDEKVPMVIVANKVDKDNNTDDREISRLEAETTVNIDWGNGYVEASAKDNVNVIGIFKELLSQAKVSYALSPAIRRRQRSLPRLPVQKKKMSKIGKRHSCVIS